MMPRVATVMLVSVGPRPRSCCFCLLALGRYANLAGGFALRPSAGCLWLLLFDCHRILYSVTLILGFFVTVLF